MKCRDCGAENPDNSKYCQECGEKLDETKNHADSETNDSSKVNPRKRILIGIISLLVIVAFIATLFGSGFSFLGGNKTYQDDEISFNYPANWNETHDFVSGGTIVSVGNNTGNGYNGVVTIKSYSTKGYNSLKDFANSQYNTVSYVKVNGVTTTYSYEIISSQDLTVDGVPAYELDLYQVSKNSTSSGKIRFKSIFLQKNNYYYGIICFSTPETFDNQQNNFNTVINSFHLKK